MSQPYRVEREFTPPGKDVQATFRVIVRLGKGWGTVQTGLDYESAGNLCQRLLDNEAKKRGQALIVRPGYRR